MNKVVANADEAIRDVFEGASVMIGGFGLCGMPENLIRALVRKGTKNLHTISNNVGIDGVGNGLLLAAGQIVHHIGTYVGENKLLEELVLTGKIKLELVPQGTFAPGARGFRRSLRLLASEQLSLRARKRASLMAVST
jgi:3-oxoacid CoA-transferase subunit A